MPVLTVGGTSARIELRSGIRHSTVAYLGSSLSRALHESDARAVVRLLPQLELGGELRHARAEEGAYSYAGANAALALGAFDAWGSVGRWLEDALRAGPGTSASVAASAEAADRRSWRRQRLFRVRPV